MNPSGLHSSPLTTLLASEVCAFRDSDRSSLLKTCSEKDLTLGGYSVIKEIAPLRFGKNRTLPGRPYERHLKKSWTPKKMQAPKLAFLSRKDTLKNAHSHPRDARIVFFEKDHIYYVGVVSQPVLKEDGAPVDPATCQMYISVTTWASTFFKKFDPKETIMKMKRSRNYKEGHKYWGMSDAAIEAQWKSTGENASSSGTNMHDQIEGFLNQVVPDHVQKQLGEQLKELRHVDLMALYSWHYGYLQPIEQKSLDYPEWNGFMHFVQDHLGFCPYRTEWRIFHEELQLAGSIDIVYQDPDVPNGLILADWKRSKEIKTTNEYRDYGLHWSIGHLHNTNFSKYSLQLNIYKYVLESKYGKVVTRMFLVQIHPELDPVKCPRGYQLWEVPNLQREVGLLAAARLEELQRKK